MTAEEAAQKAEQNFKEGFNCAQSVLCTFSSEIGLSKDTALKTAPPFGGGVCRMSEICGPVTGMLMTLGFLEGSADPKDKDSKDRIYKTGQLLMQKFKEQNGSFICRELLGLAPMGESQKYLASNTVAGSASSPVSEERTGEYYKKRPCAKLCGDAARILAEYLAAK